MINDKRARMRFSQAARQDSACCLESFRPENCPSTLYTLVDTIVANNAAIL